jgi:long-subunit fatty acid transport protein
VVLLSFASVASAQGIIVPSAGPINSAMAGASTAAPTDFGASYWNPAILSGLEDNEVLIGSALSLPSIHLQSAIAADSIGGLFPTTNRYGEARSNSGVAAGLATGFSSRMSDDSPVTFGLGVFSLAGGGVNFPGSTQVPVRNTLSMGASYNITEDITASLSWVHGFRNSSEGSILQLPGSSVRLDAQSDTLWMGVNIKFGRKKQRVPADGLSNFTHDEPITIPASSYDPGLPAPPSAPFAGDGGTTANAISDDAPSPAVPG